jgi:hypothetical protein
MDFYDPIICPECKESIESFSDIHINNNNVICYSQLKAAYVYLLHDLDADLLKIGYTTNMKKRLHQIKLNNNNKVVFVSHFLGSRYNEKILHNKWSKYRIKQEWFSHEHEIVEYFENHPRKEKFLFS